MYQDRILLTCKDILEKDIKKLGMKHSDLFKPEWVQIALDRYKYNSNAKRLKLSHQLHRSPATAPKFDTTYFYSE